MSDHYVFCTTNLINGMTYTGMTSRDLPNTNYIGSGAEMEEAIKKFGRENFKREIIGIYPTREMALLAEKIEVGDEWTASTNYNLIKGGGADPRRSRFKHSTKTKQFLSGSGNPMYKKTPWNKGRSCSSEQKEKISYTLRQNPNTGIGKRKPVEIDGIEFKSIKEAAIYFNVHIKTINRWINGYTKNRYGKYI